MKKRKIIKIQHLLMITMLTGIMTVVLCFDCLAISRKVHLSELAGDAEFVILGGTDRKKLIFKEEKDSLGKVIPTVETEGVLHSIKVLKVLFAEEKSWEGNKEVFIFQKGISMDSAVFLPDKSYLLFLKKDTIDSAFVEKYNLPKDNYFYVAAGGQGQMESSETAHIEAIKKIYAVKAIANKKQRNKEWQRLLGSDNEIVRRFARDELEKSGRTRKDPGDNSENAIR